MSDDEPSLYRRLGVTPAATTNEIRDAYRALAIRFHPDRFRTASPTDRALAERRMREINEAWAVLGDRDRRRTYDRGRSRGSEREAATETPPRAQPEMDEPVEGTVPGRLHLIRHLPWLALVVVLILIVVFTAYADRDSSPSRDRVPQRPEAGSCIDVEPGPSAVVVSCDGPHEYRVVERVADPADCPKGSEGRRLDRDGRFDCLENA